MKSIERRRNILNNFQKNPCNLLIFENPCNFVPPDLGTPAFEWWIKLADLARLRSGSDFESGFEPIGPYSLNKTPIRNRMYRMHHKHEFSHLSWLLRIAFKYHRLYYTVYTASIDLKNCSIQVGKLLISWNRNRMRLLSENFGEKWTVGYLNIFETCPQFTCFRLIKIIRLELNRFMKRGKLERLNEKRRKGDNKVLNDWKRNLNFAAAANEPVESRD